MDEHNLKRFARYGGPDLTDIRGVSILTIHRLGIMPSNNELNSTVRRRIRRVSLFMEQLGHKIRETLSRYIVLTDNVHMLVLQTFNGQAFTLRLACHLTVYHGMSCNWAM
ncbi:hypothetical protein BDV37DRAFT_238633 [Aspergillus pseudonomiae]|uniref:Uncharacterized protein n=1 Tax=Aspergillus pseudonomiae TaxID=1506151 RepID=A0A5N7DPQ6_9EURO|nr:uncharacterized protein BDV37DRAFT_238633 [Aspergillus pseudonomiae]KAE8408432.1 hypothetical protein BDV37DRAFT_238633 [Aspergillus pseudonomiae]